MDTKTSEATQVSATSTESLYCIAHERMVKTEQGANGQNDLRHPEGDWKEEPTFCHFEEGWATCPPEDEPTEADPDYMFNGDWAAQDTEDDWYADEMGAWED